MLSKYPTHIICHYAEIALKGQNRIYFEKILKNNIKQLIELSVPDSIAKIERVRGRFILHLSDSGQKSVSDITEVLKNVFGLAYFSPAFLIDSDIDAIKKNSIELMQRLNFGSFRVTARQIDKRFPFSAQSLNEEIGAEIVVKLKKSVDLSKPEAICYIDVLNEELSFIMKRSRLRTDYRSEPAEKLSLCSQVVLTHR